MLGPRSARGRAILAGTVLVLLLVGMGALAVWRAREAERALETVDLTSSAATALEGAQARFWLAQAALSALVISGDPAWVDDYDNALEAANQDLAEARTEFQAMGEVEKVSALDDLALRIDQFNETARPLFPVIIESDRQAVIELANSSMAGLTATNTAIIADLEDMGRQAQQDAAAERAAANQAAEATLWLLLGLSGVALATGIGTMVMLVRSVVGPLAALRASARAIASGSLEARARVFGPEEVASLARDFNEMTDALAAKTKAAQESERRYRLLADNASDIIWTMDMSLQLTYESPSVTRIRGYTPEEAMAQTMEETLTPASLQVARKALVEELAIEKTGQKDFSRSRTLELEHTCKDGSTVWLEVTTTFLRDENGRAVGLLGASRDIRERKQAEEERQRLHAELELRVITDSLTGLCNHAYFYERLSEELERSGRYNGGFAVAMMDVDNFKHFNDSCGHQQGDEMLRLVADSIRAGLRRSDLAFRYGGDEFAAILLHANAARARRVIDRINRHLAKSLKQMNHDAAARVSLSAGIACFPEEGSTTDELVRVADTALYSAKWAARARYTTRQECAIEALAPPPAMATREMRSTTAGSLAAVLRELGVPDVMAEMNLRTIAALGTLAEIKDPYVRGHQKRTSDVAATLAEKMGLSPDRVRGTRLAGLVHDLGKAGVSKRTLRKPGKLTEEEFAEIKEHPPLGSMMIISEVEALQQLVPIVRHHHERFDGKGYPDGLAGDEIPLEARILAVVDAFDAMIHERPYRKALSREEALAEVKRGAGTQFDPAVVEMFLAWAAKEGEKSPARRQSANRDEELAAVPTTRT